MKDVPVTMSKSEKDRLEKAILEDPLLQTLSTYKDANTRRHRTANRNKSIGGNNRDVDVNLVTKASIEVPMKWDGSSLVAEKNINSQIVCGIPASVNNGRWSAVFRGSSIVRGPLGCASGALNLVYHPSIVNGSELHGGIQVGDQASLSAGGLIRRGTKSSLGVSTVCSKQRTSSFATTLSVQHKFKPCLVSSRITLGRQSPSWNVSVSPSLKKHKAQFGFGWNRSRPLLSMMLSPMISAHRHGSMIIHWRPSGGWNVGATLTQSLASKVASLGIGVRLSKKKGLEWIFTCHRGDVTLRIPINITQYSNIGMNCLQVAYLSVLSQVIQDVIADLWKLNASSGESEALRKEQQRLKRGKARSDAERQKQLMLKQSQSRAKEEQAKQGLVIRRATYQVEGGDSWDVTTQLQFWTENSSLTLPPYSKKDLLGFYDVAGEVNGNSALDSSWLQDFWQSDTEETPNTPTPSLSVEYYYADRLYKITILDDEELELPSSKAVPAAAEYSHVNG